MEDEVRAVFDKYIAVQNAHDLKSMRGLLADSPDLLWISRGKPVWGREAALKSLEERYKGTWRIDVERKELRIISVSRRVAQVYAPTQLTVGDPGVDPSKTRGVLGATRQATVTSRIIANVFASTSCDGTIAAPSPAMDASTVAQV